MGNLVLKVVSDLMGRSALLTYNARLRFTNKPTSTCKPSSLSGQRCQSAQMRQEVRLKATGVEVVNLTYPPTAYLRRLVSRSICRCLMTIKEKGEVRKPTTNWLKAFASTSPNLYWSSIFGFIFFPSKRSINYNLTFVKEI